MGTVPLSTGSFHGVRDAVINELMHRLIVTSGAEFFVSNVTADGGEDIVTSPNPATAKGKSIQFPFKTLDYAIGQCSANKGDTIYVMPGHTESVTAAAVPGTTVAGAISFDVDGVTVVGLGTGRNRPVITLSGSTAAQIAVSGNGTTIKNMVFDFTGIDAIVAAINLNASDITFEDCEFITNSATNGVVLGLNTASTSNSPRLTLRRCRFIGAQTNSGTTTTAQVKHEAGPDLNIEDCFFTGKMTQAILNQTTVLRAKLSRNIIHTYTGTLGFSFETASTGFATDNRICVASGTTPVAGAALSFSGNRYTTEGNGPTGGTADAF